MTQDDLTLPMQHNTQQDDETLISPYPAQAQTYPQETISPPPPAPYYAQPEAPAQPADPSGQETTASPQNNAYYPQAPATLAQATGNPNYGAATPSPLAAPPKSQWSRKKFLLLGGAIILALFLLGIAGAWLVPSFLAQGNGQNGGTTTTSANPTVRARQIGIYASYLTRYGPTIRNQIAQGLHLTTDQLATRLRSGQTLSTIATAQGVSASQLQTLVTNAFQHGFQPAVTSGNLTQQQVNTLVKRMLRQPRVLARYLEVRPKANATPANN